MGWLSSIHRFVKEHLYLASSVIGTPLIESLGTNSMFCWLLTSGRHSRQATRYQPPIGKSIEDDIIIDSKSGNEKKQANGGLELAGSMSFAPQDAVVFWCGPGLSRIGTRR